MDSKVNKEMLDDFFYHLDNYTDFFTDVFTNLDENLIMKDLAGDMTPEDYESANYDTKAMLTLRYVLNDWFERSLWTVDKTEGD